MPKFYAYNSNNPNSEEGPRTAAVLTFSGDTSDSMVKELTQNSLDARADRNGSLKIKVSLIEVNKSEIPDFSNFQQMLTDMKEYYKDTLGGQYNRFFQSAFESLKNENIKILVFEDFLTKGLTGDDADPQGTFKKCVNDENISGGKETDSLGNHGIGKNSVFGYSAIHTVFYSSLNLNNEYKFKGVSKLGTYKDRNGQHKSNRIYYGNVDSRNETITLVDELNEIPSIFRRNQVGLSQFVLSAEVGENWQNNILKAFIANYWFLLDQNKLCVTIGDIELNSDNYFDLCISLFERETKIANNPLNYIRAYKEGIKYEEEISFIGNINFHLLEANGLSNRILFLRDGMKIKTDSLGVGGLPTTISGIMYCTNPDGNAILGAMEPHAHDDFRPALVEKKQTVGDLTKIQAEKILKEINDFKILKIRELKSKYSTEVTNVDIVDQLFSGINVGFKGNNGVGNDNSTKKETFNIRNVYANAQIEFNSSSNVVTTIPLNNDSGVEDGDGPEAGVGKGGSGLRGGKGRVNGRNGGGRIGDGTRKSSGKKNLKFRSFLLSRNGESSVYNVILKSQDFSGLSNIIISQTGDSSKGESLMGCEILNVTDSRNNNINIQKILNNDGFVSSYELLNVNLSEIEVLKLEVIEKSLTVFKIVSSK